MSGVKITGNLVPNQQQDTYALLEDIYLLGGFRTVADTTERDNIPIERRKWGMLVYVQQNGVLYILQANTNDLSDNNNWVPFALQGDAGKTRITETFEINQQQAINKSIQLQNNPDLNYHFFVYLNGIYLDNNDYTLNNTTINFTQDLTEGDFVVVKYTY